MKKRILGRTGLEVSELSLGGLFVSNFAAEQAEANLAVKRALELGVNYIDTAPGYANSEEALGIALEGLDFDYYIATKLGGKPVPFNAQDKKALIYSFEESLRLLKKDRVDLLLIHEPDRPGQNDWWSDKEKFYGPVSDLLAELKDKGLIKYIGLGGTTAYQMPRIMETGIYDVVLTAFQYSLLWREAAIDVLPTAKKHNMGIIIGSPLQQGALARKWPEVETGAWWLSSVRQKQYKALYSLVDDLKVELAELAVRFVLSNPDVSTVLSGSRSVAEVESNVAAAEKGPLPKDVLDRLDEIAAMVPFHPFEEPFSMPFGGRQYNGPWLAR
jgi:aryl-alcohol dehydrogenase-like predicted oxidoreductase